MFQNPYWPFFGANCCRKASCPVFESSIHRLERARQPRRHVEHARFAHLAKSPHDFGGRASEVELQHRVVEDVLPGAASASSSMRFAWTKSAMAMSCVSSDAGLMIHVAPSAAAST